MISRNDLGKLARARLADSQALLRAHRYDGGKYLCGYAVEIALKARICKTLKWEGFPSAGKEFQDFSSFRTHDLEVLLKLSGLETKIRSAFLNDWSVLIRWGPESRYETVGTTAAEELELMVGATERLLGVL